MSGCNAGPVKEIKNLERASKCFVSGAFETGMVSALLRWDNRGDGFLLDKGLLKWILVCKLFGRCE